MTVLPSVRDAKHHVLCLDCQTCVLVCCFLQGAVSGSVQASDRLMKELREIYRSQSYKTGTHISPSKAWETQNSHATINYHKSFHKKLYSLHMKNRFIWGFFSDTILKNLDFYRILVLCLDYCSIYSISEIFIFIVIAVSTFAVYILHNVASIQCTTSSHFA